MRVNDHYTLANDEGEPFFELNGIFINNRFGYQLDEHTSIGLNLEYDRYTKQALNFLPVYADIKYNIIVQDDNAFIRAGYGKLFAIANSFENGTLYKIGFGYQIFDSNLRNSFLFGFDFSRKRFGFKQQDKLSSLSIFLEFMLF